MWEETKASSLSSHSIIWSLCFQRPRMPCGNLLLEPIRGYYRSFWWSTTEEMWSGSSDFFFSSVTHPQRPWGRTSVTGPIQLQITFVLRPFLFEQRDRPLFQIRADVTAGQGLWRLVFSVFVFTSRSQHYDSPWRFFISALKVLHDFYEEYFRATASDTPWQFMFLS